ncbi:unnamed protein product [Pleuronectes platessa]|uniref:Uncharacterized protein n=1 Tax=Pleuronectes platessa TaxID=8262 RepID=A0A9N7VT97_PLEPL|nr:unnamed protein product [Pleuronectes platessa]
MSNLLTWEEPLHDLSALAREAPAKLWANVSSATLHPHRIESNRQRIIIQSRGTLSRPLWREEARERPGPGRPLTSDLQSSITSSCRRQREQPRRCSPLISAGRGAPRRAAAAPEPQRLLGCRDAGGTRGWKVEISSPHLVGKVCLMSARAHSRGAGVIDGQQGTQRGPGVLNGSQRSPACRFLSRACARLLGGETFNERTD